MAMSISNVHERLLLLRDFTPSDRAFSGMLRLNVGDILEFKLFTDGKLISMREKGSGRRSLGSVH